MRKLEDNKNTESSPIPSHLFFILEIIHFILFLPFCKFWENTFNLGKHTVYKNLLQSEIENLFVERTLIKIF